MWGYCTVCCSLHVLFFKDESFFFNVLSLDTLCFELLLLLMLLLLLFLLLLLLLLLLLPCLFLIITLYMYVDSVLFGFTEQGRVYPEGDHARVPWCGGSKSRHRRSVTWFLILSLGWIKNKISFWTPAPNKYNMVLNL